MEPSICTAGSYCVEGSLSPVACAPGEYSVAGQATPSTCPAGAYCPNAATVNPLPCPEGYACSDGTVDPAICPAGGYSGVGSAACSDCNPGSYQTQEGQSSCISCPEGNRCPSGSVTPIICEAGSYSEQEAESCTPCEGGFSTSNSQGRGNCDACQPGFYSEAGAAACTICPGNFYSDTPASAACKECAPGRISDPGAIEASACVNPIFNFAISFGVLVLLFFVSTYYVFKGRFHKIAFQRIWRVIEPLERACRRLNMKLTVLMQIFNKGSRKQEHLSQVKSKFRVVLFLVVGTISTLVGVFLAYAFTLARILFAVILVWKGFDYEGLNVKGLRNKLEEIRNALLYELNCPWLGYMMYPFMLFFNMLARMKLDFSAVEVIYMYICICVCVLFYFYVF